MPTKSTDMSDKICHLTTHSTILIQDSGNSSLLFSCFSGACSPLLFLWNYFHLVAVPICPPHSPLYLPASSVLLVWYKREQASADAWCCWSSLKTQEFIKVPLAQEQWSSNSKSSNHQDFLIAHPTTKIFWAQILNIHLLIDWLINTIALIDYIHYKIYIKVKI